MTLRNSASMSQGLTEYSQCILSRTVCKPREQIASAEDNRRREPLMSCHAHIRRMKYGSRDSIKHLGYIFSPSKIDVTFSKSVFTCLEQI